MTEVKTCRIEFTRDRSLHDFGDNYGAWLALLQYQGEDLIIEQIEVFPTSNALFIRSHDDKDVYKSGNAILVELLMQAGWEIAITDNGGRVTNMHRLN